MKDCHVHTNLSHDGISSIAEYMAYAPTIGVDEITFTEHYDDYTGLKTKLYPVNIAEYYGQYLQHKNDDIVKINFGIEIGLQPHIVDFVNCLASQYPFDFIIGSSHITCKKDVGSDPSFFDGYSRKENYLRYFNEVLQNILLHNQFDVYGHLDYVVRYGSYAETKIEYKEFQEILDEILISLIKKDKGIEVNTSAFRYGLGNPHPNCDILKRYKDLGGKIITLGSDAHKTQDLCSHFNEILDVLEQIGYTEMAVYHHRIPDFIKIDDLKKR